MNHASLAMRICLTLTSIAPLVALADESDLPRAEPVGELEVVATFDGPIPTGVAVSHAGRVFVNFPRWGDPVDFTVAEVKDGKVIPYPDADLNRFDKNRPDATLVSVQSVVVDPANRLWLLDTGSIEFGPTLPGGPKLVGVDLTSNQVFQTIRFPEDVALKTTYLNDVRFDLRQGKAGVAYITDSSQSGPNGLIVVDLETGESRRRLHDHPSTKADKNFLPIVEGRPLMTRPRSGKPQPMTTGADGVAISHDGKYLYFCPLSSRRFYRVSTDKLLDENASKEDVAGAVELLETRGFASDGLESDAQGRVYLTDYEHNAVLRRTAEGEYETVVYDPRVLWPDTLALAMGGHLYFTANQLHRRPPFHEGRDLRRKPYVLFRVHVDASPVLLRPTP